MTNHLAGQSSLYLLHHAENPVDWYPWGDEALEKARRENKLIFLSIGYNACHWCHVMEKESFQNEEIAGFLNAHFVSIKVDREERPDLDQIYMSALLAITGQGGWPLSMILLPSGEPFFGGTYFPPDRRHGMQSFQDVFSAVQKVWLTDPKKCSNLSVQLTEHLKERTAWGITSTAPLQNSVLDQAVANLENSYDWQHGGWGHAPKFPQPLAVEFLLLQASRGNQAALKLACHALDAMSLGGMHDLVSGGFHRYSTDSSWLVPHFEKMLYDNAQIARAYLHAYILTRNPWYRFILNSTLRFLANYLASEEGAFFSSLDADSGGVEGSYYSWGRDDFELLLPPTDYAFLQEVCDLPENGNFEKKIILRLKDLPEKLAQKQQLSIDDFLRRFESVRSHLEKAQSQKIAPGVDDKYLASWNGLMLVTLSEAARYLNSTQYLDDARRLGNFLLEKMVVDGKLVHSRKGKIFQSEHFLEDYSAVIDGLLSLYQSDPDVSWFKAADTLASVMIDEFLDEAGGFYDTPASGRSLILRPKELQDNVTPSGNSLAARAVYLLSRLSPHAAREEMVSKLLAEVQSSAARQPLSFSGWLSAIDFSIGPVEQLAILVEENELPVWQVVIWNQFRPHLVMASAGNKILPEHPEIIRDRMACKQPAAFLCVGQTCLLPAQNPQQLANQLSGIQKL